MLKGSTPMDLLPTMHLEYKPIIVKKNIESDNSIHCAITSAITAGVKAFEVKDCYIKIITLNPCLLSFRKINLNCILK
jgi:hypothetical protein